MARRKIASTIDVSGPFFTNDPRKTFRQNARVMLAAIAAEGEADVKVQLVSAQGVRSPLRYPTARGIRVSDHVVGRVKSLSGKPWQVTAVVSVNASGASTRQAIGLMAAASYIERRNHVFRRTTSRLRKAKKLNAAELLKGIA